MKAPIEIRAYQTADKEAVINLIRLNTPAYFARGEEAELSRYLESERELYYVILSEGDIVGCGGINFEDDNGTGIISWDIIHPAHQGKSLGARLVLYRLEKLKATEGIQKVAVRTSQLTFKFYEKQGFRLVEIVKDHWAEGFDMYRMEFAGPLVRKN